MGSFDVGFSGFEPNRFKIPFVLNSLEDFDVSLVDAIDRVTPATMENTQIAITCYLHGIFMQQVG